MFKFGQKAEERGNYAIMVWMKINFMMNLVAIQPREDHKSLVYGAQIKILDIYHFQLRKTYVPPPLSILSNPDLIFVFLAPAGVL